MISKKIFQFILGHRITILALSFLVCLLLIYLGRNVKTDFSVEQFFPVWDPARKVYNEYKKNFPKEDTQFALFWQENGPVTVEVFNEMSSAAAIFTKENLNDIVWFGNMEIAENVTEDGENILKIHPLIREDNITTKYLKKRLSKFKHDPILKNFLWNDKQNIFVIYGYIDQTSNTNLARKTIEGALTKELRFFEKPGRKLLLNGLPVVRSRYLKTLEVDQVLFMGGAILIVFLIMYYFFRHVTQILLCFASIIPAYLFTLALMGIYSRPITVLTSLMPLIFLVIGLSDTIHILSHYRGMLEETNDNVRAIVLSFQKLSTPCFYTSLTTAVGYLCLVSTGISIIVDFAILTSIGILLSYFCAMVYLPILISFYSKKEFNTRGLNSKFVSVVLKNSITLSRTKSKQIILINIVIVIFALYSARNLSVNAYMIDDLKKSHPLMEDLRYIETNGFGIFQHNLYLKGSKENEIVKLRNLEWMEKYQKFIEKESLVIKTISIVDKIKWIRKAIMDGKEEEYKLPKSDNELFQLMLFADMGKHDFFEDLYHGSDNEAQILTIINDGGSRVTVPFLNKIDDFIKNNPPSIPFVQSTGTVELAQISFVNIVKGFYWSLFLAMGLILIIMIIMFRSIKFGLIALIPNAVPIILTLGALPLLGFEIKPSTVMIFSVAFGIAVDDTIHFLGIFRYYETTMSSYTEAIEKTICHSGKAIMITSAVICIGFSAMMISRFEVIFLIGLLTSLSLLAALLTDLFLLPSVLYVFRKDRHPRMAKK